MHDRFVLVTIKRISEIVRTRGESNEIIESFNVG